jgi:hypothetical protein
VSAARGAAGRARSEAWRITEEEVDRVAALYPQVAPNPIFWTESGALKEFTNEELLSYLAGVVDPTSGPGFPWVSEGCNTIADVLQHFPDLLCARVRARLADRLLAIEACENLFVDMDYSPYSLVECNLRDVCRVFPKGEPHDKVKISQGRVRLIMNTGFTDIVIERMLVDAICQREVALFGTHPSLTGMGLNDELGSRVQAIIFRPQADPTKKPRGGDVSAFDWSVAEEALVACKRVEAKQYRVPQSSDLYKLLIQQARITARRILVLCDGSLYSLPAPGGQESGSRDTHSGNSKMRFIAAWLLGMEAVTNGDDDVEYADAQDVERLPALYAQYFGWNVSFPVEEKHPEAVEFCSTLFFPSGTFYPTSWPKTLFRLLGKQPDADLLAQFSYEQRHHPRLPEFLDIIERTWFLNVEQAPAAA